MYFISHDEVAVVLLKCAVLRLNLRVKMNCFDVKEGMTASLILVCKILGNNNALCLQ
jgi:hypothetical protein